VQTGPPALLRSQVRHPLLLRFIALATPGDERLAETEGFEPSIGLYNPITV
jgi:hypothetical protein